MDLIKYSEAFDRFINRMEQFTEPFTWEHQATLEEVCELLRIGKIDLEYFESVRNEELSNGDFLSFYQMGVASVMPTYVGRHVSVRGTVLIFKFYNKLDDLAWNEQEMEKIKIFDKLLYTFNEKVRLTQLAETAFFYDRDLHIPNMSYFNRDFRRLAALEQFSEYGICVFNLKRYSVINQLVGRKQGTRVMVQFISRLQQKLRKNGQVCRMGGDNFIILFKKSELDTICSYLVGTEIVYDNLSKDSVIVRASAGIYLIKSSTDDAEEAIEKAHIASQKARYSIGESIIFYDDSLKSMHEHVSLIESMFREAIDREEFDVYYQPKVQLMDYKIAGAEALCRWRHNGELIRPDEFIPVLEQSNLICTLDFYMLEHVCSDIRKWLDNNLNVVRVSVNLSRRHLGDEKLLDRILEIIDKYSVPHQYIEIELTETTTDVAFSDLKRIVNGLHDHGIHTSVDDFGVGYSSLNLIRQVSWDVVKIDKSFLPEVSDRSSVQYLMFSNLLAMFRELGQKCIVEGVETIEQVKMLKENKCFLAQGYFFDKPLEVDEFEKRLSVS